MFLRSMEPPKTWSAWEGAGERRVWEYPQLHTPEDPFSTASRVSPGWLPAQALLVLVVPVALSIALLSKPCWWEVAGMAPEVVNPV